LELFFSDIPVNDLGVYKSHVEGSKHKKVNLSYHFLCDFSVRKNCATLQWELI